MTIYTVTLTDTQEADSPEEAAIAFIEQIRFGVYEREDVIVEEK